MKIFFLALFAVAAFADACTDNYKANWVAAYQSMSTAGDCYFAKDPLWEYYIPGDGAGNGYVLASRSGKRDNSTETRETEATCVSFSFKGKADRVPEKISLSGNDFVRGWEGKIQPDLVSVYVPYGRGYSRIGFLVAGLAVNPGAFNQYIPAVKN